LRITEFVTGCAVERNGTERNRLLALLEQVTVRPDLLERLLTVVLPNRS
jgi:hypothetical protein